MNHRIYSVRDYSDKLNSRGGFGWQKIMFIERGEAPETKKLFNDLWKSSWSSRTSPQKDEEFQRSRPSVLVLWEKLGNIRMMCWTESARRPIRRCVAGSIEVLAGCFRNLQELQCMKLKFVDLRGEELGFVSWGGGARVCRAKKEKLGFVGYKDPRDKRENDEKHSSSFFCWVHPSGDFWVSTHSQSRLSFFMMPHLFISLDWETNIEWGQTIQKPLIVYIDRFSNRLFSYGSRR